LAWRLIQGFCVTGTFTTRRIALGLPQAQRAMVMALETQIRQSLVRPLATRARDLARTPPPALLFLQIYLSKSKPADDNASQSPETGFRDNGILTGVAPVENHDCDREERCPLRAAKQRVPRTRPQLISIHSRCQHLDHSHNHVVRTRAIQCARDQP